MLAVGRVDAGVGLGVLGMYSFVVDEQPKLANVLLQPGVDGRGGLRCRAVVHGSEDF